LKNSRRAPSTWLPLVFPILIATRFSCASTGKTLSHLPSISLAILMPSNPRSRRHRPIRRRTRPNQQSSITRRMGCRTRPRPRARRGQNRIRQTSEAFLERSGAICHRGAGEGIRCPDRRRRREYAGVVIGAPSRRHRKRRKPKPLDRNLRPSLGIDALTND